MTTPRRISRIALRGLFESVIRGGTLIGPQERKDQPGFFSFGPIENPDEIDLAGGIEGLPPKAAFFPPQETLFTFSLSETPPLLDAKLEDAPVTLAGVHPCDLAAVGLLDMALGRPPEDHRWFFRRKRALVIGTDCTPDDYCFCASTGTAHARDACDLFLTEISDGYLAEIYTPKGRELLSGVETAAATEEDLWEADQWRAEKVRRMSAHLNADIQAIADALEKDGMKDVWKETAARCYSCGSCNLVCPACFCFHMDDRFDLSLENGFRFRTWDSCQLPEFALTAGGNNFRDARWRRVRHRWRRKFLYLYREFGQPFCTGCGRCSRACTAGVNIVDVTNRLIHDAGRDPKAPGQG